MNLESNGGPEEGVLECPICGVTENTKGKPFKKVKQVVGHARAAHNQTITKEEILSGTSSYTPTPRGTTPKSVGTVLEDGRLVPDAYESFKSLLIKYGATKVKAERATQWIKDRDLDDMNDVFDACSQIRMAQDDKNMFLDVWATERGVKVPLWLVERMRDTEHKPHPTRSREYGGSPESYQIRKAEELGELRARNKQLEDQNKEYEEDESEETSTSDRLLEQLEEKDKALLDERQRSHEKEMASQRQMFELQMKNIDERIARMEKDQNKSIEQTAALMIASGGKKIGDAASKFLAYMMEEDARPPVRERGGPSSVAEMVEEVAPHLVVEPFELTPRSRGVQNIEVQNTEVPVKRRRFSGSVVNDKDVGAPVEPTEEVKEE